MLYSQNGGKTVQREAYHDDMKSHTTTWRHTDPVQEKEMLNKQTAELQEKMKQFERQKLQLQLQQQKQRLLNETKAAVAVS